MTTKIQSEQALITLLTTVPDPAEISVVWRGLPFTVTRDGHERRVVLTGDDAISGELIYDERLHTAIEVAQDIVYLASVAATGTDR